MAIQRHMKNKASCTAACLTPCRLFKRMLIVLMADLRFKML